MKKAFFIILFILSTVFSLISCNSNKSERIYLRNTWYYSIQGKDGPFSPIDTNDFNNLSAFLMDRKGYIWLKTNFYVPDSQRKENLSCNLGIIKIANETFLNDTYLGKTGYFPPNEFTNGELSTVFPLPRASLHYGALPNELLIQIWVNGYGKISSTPYIGPTDAVNHSKEISDFFYSKVFLIFSSLMMIIAAIYLLLYNFRRVEKNYLSFSRICFFSSFYIITVCIGEFPIILSGKLNFLLCEQLFHASASVLSSFFTVSFMRDFLRKEDTNKLNIFRITITIVSFIIIFSARDLISLIDSLKYVYIITTIHMIYAVQMIIRSMIDRNKRVWTLLFGFSPVILSLLVSLFFLIYNNIDLPVIFVLATGWLLTILVFLGILIHNFAISQAQVEYLNKNLEKIVRQRTSELESSNNLLASKNSELEFEKERTEKEIELASFVQQSFYNQNLPKLTGWEVAYYLKPLSGVSGDLYDFFHKNNKLLGLGVFDVSGHGISSGLVTMLVKNIIEQEFYSGEDKKLDDIMNIINDRVIAEKGNIENYLTGTLVRFYEDRMDFVSAGHPPALLLKHDSNSPEFIYTNETQYGVVGIADFPINFQTYSVELNQGDSLLFYTDGITEAMNSNREEFGKKRLYDAFQRFKDLTLNEQIKSLVNEVYAFRGTEKLDDDITLIILKKI